MGSTQSKERQRDPQQFRPLYTKYEEFERPLVADPFRGPTPQEIGHINEYQPWQFEPTDDSKPPLLVLAKDNEEWFWHLIQKCDPNVTWKGQDGRKKELGRLLLGNGTRNHAVWSTKLDEWKRRPRGSVTTATPDPSSASSPVLGRQTFLREFGNVALALGITVGGAALGLPAAALGPVVWVAIRSWHSSFSTEIGSTRLGGQELQELQNRFDACARLLGKVIIQLGTQIEEMARIGRSRKSQREKKRIMMAKLRSLWDLCTTQEVLYTNKQILRRMSSQQEEAGGVDTMPRASSYLQSPNQDEYGILGPMAGGDTAPLTASARAGSASFTFDV